MGQYDTERLTADLLPRVGTRWCGYEKKALEIRKMAGFGLSDRFEPERLAQILNFHILKFTTIAGLPDNVREIISTSDQWSGAAIPTNPDVDGHAGLIIINDLHSNRRQRATLMEEICHLLLGHRPSRIDQRGRTYDHQIEEEAYAIGAATLLPFKPLREMVESNYPVRYVADYFDVSKQLVNYRLRVLGIRPARPSPPSTDQTSMDQDVRLSDGS